VDLDRLALGLAYEGDGAITAERGRARGGVTGRADRFPEDDARRVFAAVDASEGLFDGVERPSQDSDLTLQVVRKFVSDMGVERVYRGHIDEPRPRVAANGDRHEPAAHLVGQLVDERGKGDDGRQERDHASCEFLFEGLLGQVPELQEGAYKRDLCDELAIKGSFDFGRVDGTGCDQATPELDGHGATLSPAPLTSRDTNGAPASWANLGHTSAKRRTRCGRGATCEGTGRRPRRS